MAGRDPLPQRAARRTVTVTHEAMRTLIAERNRAMSACEAIAQLPDNSPPQALAARQTARQALERHDPAPVTLDDVTVRPAPYVGNLPRSYAEVVRSETEDTL